jgi:hypothetical protein
VAALDLRNNVHTGIVVAVGNGTITTVEGRSNVPSSATGASS